LTRGGSAHGDKYDPKNATGNSTNRDSNLSSRDYLLIEPVKIKVRSFRLMNCGREDGACNALSILSVVED
jgi:hypothetical protein